jgi:LuxR family maltose regulon positive regulatory protein
MPGPLTQPKLPHGAPRASALRLVRHGAPDGAGSGRLWPAPAATAPTAVPRPRLLHALAATPAPLTVVVAPAGFGKTTLLRQWAASDARACVHVTLDARHDDPARLAATLAAVMRGAAPHAGDPHVVMLDDVHVLTTDAATATLTGFAGGLGAHVSLVLAARTEPSLPLARLRAQRMLCELGARELAMTGPEAAALFAASGHALDDACLALVLERTEGWPAALSLAVAFLGDLLPGSALERFSGADRLVAQYLRDEILAELPEEALAFARRVSVADTLTAPLCDALLRRRGSDAMLAALQRAGLLVALDRTEDRFRLRRLIADELRAGLARSEPGLARELHRRAGTWHHRAGDHDRAIRHLLDAGDVRAAARIAVEQVPHELAHGRTAAVERRLAGFSEAQVAAEPVLALAAAGLHLTRGAGHQAARWAAAAAEAPALAEPVEAGAVLIEAAVTRRGAARMGEDAAWAATLLPEGSPWRAAAGLLAGIAARVTGDPEAAVRRLDEAAHRSAASAPAVHALCLAQLAALALGRDDIADAELLGARARAQVDRHGLAGYAPMALVFAVSSVVRTQRGSIDPAREDMHTALRLRDALTAFPAWWAAEVELLAARAALRLGDAPRALALAGEGARRIERAPDAEGLRRSLRELQERVQALADSEATPAAGLTTAELRTLRYLPSHLSFREIAAETFVTMNTVKTHAHSVYRKLDVRSRSEAVARARSCGLLETARPG